MVRSQKLRVCQFCHRQYRRADVLRRHYRTCPSRGQQQIPGKLPRGRRRRACDACARYKLHCDLDTPCESCLSFKRTCTYSITETSDSTAELPTTSSSPAISSTLTSPSSPSPLPPLSISFLNGYQFPQLYLPLVGFEATSNEDVASIPSLLNRLNPRAYAIDPLIRSNNFDEKEQIEENRRQENAESSAHIAAESTLESCSDAVWINLCTDNLNQRLDDFFSPNLFPLERNQHEVSYSNISYNYHTNSAAELSELGFVIR